MEANKLNQDIPESGAVVQRDRETYAVVPHIPGGITNSDTLRKIADISDKYGCQVLKITSAQRIAMVGVKKEDLEQIWAELDIPKGAAIGFCVRSVKICPGMDFCKRAKQDSIKIGLEMDRRYHGMPLPNKFKIGVSGCANSCAESWVKDIGVIGAAAGYKVVVGGNAGGQPRVAEMIFEDLDADQTLQVVDDMLQLFQKGAKRGQKLSKFIDAIGKERLMKYLEASRDEQPDILAEIQQTNQK